MTKEEFIAWWYTRPHPSVTNDKREAWLAWVAANGLQPDQSVAEVPERLYPEFVAANVLIFG